MLQEVDHYKYLGTIIDSTLNINAQLSKLTQTVALKMTTFRKIWYCMSENTAKIIYKATILPIIDYNDIIYSLITNKQLTKLQRLQNNALRIIFRGKKLSVSEMHEEANIEYLKLRRETHLLTLMFDRSRQIQYIDTTDRVTRQANAILLKSPLAKTEKFARSPLCNGSKMWNALPVKVRQAQSKLHFKRLLDKYRNQVDP